MRGCIQITEPITNEIGEFFDLVDRGTVKLKGGKEIKTYFLSGAAKQNHSILSKY
jgi:hypothetical protein